MTLSRLGLTVCMMASAIGAQHNSTKYPSPPIYPSPNITGSGGWETALQKAREFLSQLSLDEKAGIVTGTPGPCTGNIAPISRLQFGGLCLQDGPLAIRQAIYASVFPAGLSAAASWDRDLVYQRGFYLGEEFRGKGSHIALGPAVGPLGRSAFGGRNWEGFSPDPYLAGALVEVSITGMQSAGVQSCVKHYIANEQETQRTPSVENGTAIDAVSSNVDDRTMHESYLWPFANAIHAGAASVMCSYNRINGSSGCQNSKTLNGLLKGELGFQGFVMSDWTATQSGIASIEAGEDMNMPGGIAFLEASPSFWGGNITIAVKNGSLSIDRIDDMVLRIMTPYYYLGQDISFPLVDSTSEALGFFPRANYINNFSLGSLVDVRANHSALIRKLGAAGTVLLKNVNGTLPLTKPLNIGVFGNDAADFTAINGHQAQDFLVPDYEIGTMPVGGGSGSGRYSYVISPLESIKTRARSYGALVQYAVSNSAITSDDVLAVLSPPPDVCLVFLKSWTSEGMDRTTLIADSNSTETVEAVAAVCPNTVVILHGAAPNVLPWRENTNVTAILAAHMPGQETGNSIVDILWGEVNPSGKLPYTIADKESDYSKNLLNSTELLSSTDPDAWEADFTEGNLIDYKYFDVQNKSVAYEFGFGLSYTTFELSDIYIEVIVKNASRTPSHLAKQIPGGNEQLWDTIAIVSATATNTGSIDGATVPQLYVSLPVSEVGANTPVKMLRGFSKVSIPAGGQASIKFPLTRRDLSFWDAVAQTWRLPSTLITISVGFSSRNLILTGALTI